jgi:hypothetical protein
MDKTFRLAKRHRNLGIACLIFFVLVAVASGVGIWAEAPEEQWVEEEERLPTWQGIDDATGMDGNCKT